MIAPALLSHAVSTGATVLAAGNDTSELGGMPGHPITMPIAIALFVGGPLVVVAIVSFLVSVPSLAGHGARYRPGFGWWYQPQWFNGPGEAPVATEPISQVPPDAPARTAGTPGGVVSHVSREGGSGARW